MMVEDEHDAARRVVEQTEIAGQALSRALNLLDDCGLSDSMAKRLRADTANIIMDLYGLLDRHLYEKYPDLTPEHLRVVGRIEDTR